MVRGISGIDEETATLFGLGLLSNHAIIIYMTRMERITVNPDKCAGRPCIRGLRIRVTDILGMLAGGASHGEILSDYPYLEAEDILAALEYAALQTDHPVLNAA
jgi:uncharacterized protein (DUF433 family)